ncbi:MAG: rhodanese-like domain-containing protein [Bacteroidetes bacterium]|nr:rhodanese-like domain-containing protein [Bacteroidota bacterium]
MNTISVEALKARLDAGEKIHLVDVREPNEHEQFNIGGLLLPVGDILSGQTDEIEALKEAEVIFYCRSGNRSGRACQVAEAMGFTNPVNLTGGMLAWIDQFGE